MLVDLPLNKNTLTLLKLINAHLPEMRLQLALLVVQLMSPLEMKLLCYTLYLNMAQSQLLTKSLVISETTSLESTTQLSATTPLKTLTTLSLPLVSELKTAWTTG